MAEHTEGPWKFSQTHEHKMTIRSAKRGDYVAEITLGDGAADALLDEANARLIAAAPEMLSVLADVADELEGRVDVDGDSEGLRGNWAAKLLMRVEQVMRKAEGT
jgi:hypothetical protein